MNQAPPTDPVAKARRSSAVGRLHVLVDSLELADLAVSAGAPVVQLRAKTLTDAALRDLAEQVAGLCGERGSTLIVNDRPDVAAAVGAGVHVGALDAEPREARVIIGEDAILGVTARTPGMALAAQDAGADYVGVGPVYVSGTKAGLPNPIGPAGVGAVAACVEIPAIAISGIEPADTRELILRGAYGVAVSGAVARAADPASVVSAFLDEIGKARLTLGNGAGRTNAEADA